ncbi:T9SS type A sorting domain-containing protein [candidate division KSB1 bacterium]|nr:T9SS type A sorting domain-containing protein [candidate division KSB1 bacterium]
MKRLLITIFIISMMAVIAHADTHYKTWQNPRDYEPLVLKTDNVPGIANMMLDQLFVYSYNSRVRRWTQIPFQIDKYYGKGRFRAPLPGETFGADDELIIMARDLGNKAASTVWIDDENSRQYERIELMVADSVSGKNRYAYIYRSQTLTEDFDASDYPMEYILPTTPGAADDKVRGVSYEQGFNEFGIITQLKLTDGQGTNVMNRQKMYLAVNYISIPLNINETILEDSTYTTVDSLLVYAGPLRIFRRIYWTLDFHLASFNPMSFDYPQFYYPYSIQTEGIRVGLKETANVKVTIARQSFDLNASAIGMTFMNPYNTTPITIDGSGGDELSDDTVDLEPLTNWYMITGDQGTIQFQFTISKIGSSHTLFYKDRVSADDTGKDGMQYGDTGIEIRDENIVGSLRLYNHSYFLEGNKSFEFGNEMGENYQHPMGIIPENQMFGTVPVELAAFDAVVVKDNVTLVWNTATETNNYGFQIQRRTRDSQHWETIGFVAGHGTTAEPRDYEFSIEKMPAGEYAFRLLQIDTDGTSTASMERLVTISAPVQFALDQNYPNPFNPTTVISYQVPEQATGAVDISLIIYNLLGEKVRTLVMTKQAAGYYAVTWDGRNDRGQIQSTGTYIYRLHAGTHIATRRMVLMK